MTETNKKENKRYLLRVVLFAGIFLVLFSALALLFSNHPDHRTYQMIDGFYDEPAGSLDGVYIGSSNCYAFWNPLVAWNNYDLAVYPYSSASQPFYATEYIIREARKTQPDALYIVNLNSVEADDLNLVAVHNLVNYMPESENKTELINYLSSLLGYSKLESLEFRFTWIRGREYWLDYIKNGFFPEQEGLKGAVRYNNYINTSTDISDKYIMTDAKAGIPDELTKYIDELLDYCDEEKVRVLFVVVPRAEKSENTLGRINLVAEMIQNRGYDVLHLTDETEAMGMDITQDFYDNMHANIHGSIKFTNYISQFLIDNYGMEEKHTDELYSSWDAAWEVYEGEIASSVLDIELDAAHRDCSLAAVQQLRAEADDAGGIAVKWNAVEGADGYAVYRKTGPYGPWEVVSAFQTATEFTDSGNPAAAQSRYTVVPVRDGDGELFYGSFSYGGTGIAG